MDNNKVMVPVSIVVAGLLIAGAVFLSKQAGPTPAVPGDDQAPKITAAPISDKDYIWGSPDAPVKIVEYSDLECPACKYFHNTVEQIMSTYGKDGKVAIIYRHFPLYKEIGGRVLHSKAGKEAEATECAAELGGSEGYYNMIRKIFSVTPSNNGLDLAKLPDLAGEIGLDKTKFKTCLDSNKYAGKIEDAYNAAVAAGVRATPSYVMITENRTVPQEGGVAFEAIKPVIDALLAE